ncbi:helix-turn-helix transcriptional regulator [Streptomyces sp. PA03-6a]|nr:helix-turn-helix transcriptional regulator [Streptomyces sp. PA03-6a]
MGENAEGGLSRPRRANELGPTGTRLTENLKRVRESVPMTTEQLAERMTSLGRPMRANTITKIEKGQRRVDVDDLVALARALRVSPATLLLPPTIHGKIELTSGDTVTAWSAWLWATSTYPLEVPEGDDGSAFAEHQLRSLPQGFRQFRRGWKPGINTKLGLIAMPDDYEEFSDELPDEGYLDEHIPAGDE